MHDDSELPDSTGVDMSDGARRRFWYPKLRLPEMIASRFPTRLRQSPILQSGLLVTYTLLFSTVVGLERWTRIPEGPELFQRAGRESSSIFDRHGVLLYEILDPLAGRRQRVSLSDLPDHLIDAVIAVEDADFYSHRGVSPRGILRATWHLMRERRIVSGGSTISQQTARLLLMQAKERSQRSLGRKLREALFALRLEQSLEKSEILEVYLNEVYFGDMSYGIEAAAQNYFGIAAGDLSQAESALLAGLIQAPALHGPRVDMDAARQRQAVVLELMVKDGRLDPQRAKELAEQPLDIKPLEDGLSAPHFVQYLRAQLEDLLGRDALLAGGLRVHSSLDAELQGLAQRIVRHRLDLLAPEFSGDIDHRAGSATVLALSPRSGQILAMLGSGDYSDPSIDGAVNLSLLPRQPGSAIKPITYAAALGNPAELPPSRLNSAVGCERGDCHPELPYTPVTWLDDAPTSFITEEGTLYRPLNYDRRWHGLLSLRTALATSSNMAAVKVLDAVGIDGFLHTARRLGIDDFDGQRDLGLALTLGGSELPLIKLSSAYAAFANGGIRIEPCTVLRVEGLGSAKESLLRSIRCRAEPENQLLAMQDRGDGVPFPKDHSDSTENPARAIEPEVAYLISDILSDDAARMPAFGEGSVLDIGRPAAVKTGTTTDFRDNWTIGYTPDLVTGVWVGNPDGQPMVSVNGVTGAGPIWHDFMVDAHRDLAPREFERPAGLVEVWFCLREGESPRLLDEDTKGSSTDSCPRRKREWVALEKLPALRSAYLSPSSQTLSALWDEAPAEPSNSELAPFIHYPPPGLRMALSQGMPASLQSLEILVQGPDLPAPGVFSLRLNAKPIATLQSVPGRVSWPLEAGRFELELVYDDQEKPPRVLDSTSFEVLASSAPEDRFSVDTEVFPEIAARTISSE